MKNETFEKNKKSLKDHKHFETSWKSKYKMSPNQCYFCKYIQVPVGKFIWVKTALRPFIPRDKDNIKCPPSLLTLLLPVVLEVAGWIWCMVAEIYETQKVINPCQHKVSGVYWNHVTGRDVC